MSYYLLSFERCAVSLLDMLSIYLIYLTSLIPRSGCQICHYILSVVTRFTYPLVSISHFYFVVLGPHVLSLLPVWYTVISWCMDTTTGRNWTGRKTDTLCMTTMRLCEFLWLDLLRNRKIGRRPDHYSGCCLFFFFCYCYGHASAGSWVKLYSFKKSCYFVFLLGPDSSK